MQSYGEYQNEGRQAFDALKRKALKKFMKYREVVLHDNDWKYEAVLMANLTGLCCMDERLWAAFQKLALANHTPYDDHAELVAMYDEAQKALEEA